MFLLRSQISTEKYIFNFCNSIEIYSSWKNLTDNASIILPRLLTLDGVDIALGDGAILKRGESVEILGGYDENLESRFTGYISQLNQDLPMRFDAQDKMYLLKQTNYNKAFKQVSLSELLAFIIPEGIDYIETLSTNLGSYRIKRASAAQVLEHLRSDYGISSFFRDDVLYVGLAYVPDLRKEFTFHMQKNVIEKSLDYQVADDIKVKATAISINDDNTRTTVTVGDEGGEERTFHYYNVSESELRAFAERDIEKARINGYVGTFTTFLDPKVSHGDAVTIIDERIPERNGTYLVKSVETKIGMGGGRQTIELDSKIL